MVDVKEGKERKPVPVKVGLMNDMVFEVLAGLTEGQEVVTGMTKEQPGQSGGSSVRPTTTIKILK